MVPVIPKYLVADWVAVPLARTSPGLVYPELVNLETSSMSASSTVAMGPMPYGVRVWSFLKGLKTPGEEISLNLVSSARTDE